MILNKNEYKEAVNKIVISDELREKIIHNSSKKNIYKRNNIYKYLQRTAGIAACFAFCILSYHAVTNYYHTPVDITMNTTPPIQTPDNSNSSDIEDNNIVPVMPNTDDIQNDDINTTDEQRLPNNTLNERCLQNNTSNERRLPDDTNNTTMAVNSSDNSTTNNFVSKENSLTVSNTNQSVQSNSMDSEHIEQDDFPPVLSASPSIDDNTPTEIIVGNGNTSGECAVYSGENMSTIKEIEQELGYDIKVPHYVPDDYEMDSLSAPFGEFAEITYTNETDTLYYRTAKSSEDISGDYNDYTDVETVTINDNDVTIKGNNNLYHNASWFAEDETFSIRSDNGVEKDTMIDIVESVD